MAFTKGTLRYVALVAANVMVIALAYIKPEVVTAQVFEYVILGDFLVAGVDVFKHIKNLVNK